MTAPQQQKKGGNPYYGIQKQPAYNVSSTNTVPAFGLVRVTGTTNGVLQVDQPNADGQEVYANGPTPIPPNRYGVVSKAWPIFVAYTGGPPTLGQSWGVASGSYLLTSGTSGFRIEAPGVSGRVLVSAAQVALSASLSSYSLTTSWSNIGTSLTLPANSTWLLTAQLNAQIVSSSSGAGDSISCRFYDGSAVAGCPVEFCNAVCDSLTFVDAASLVAVYTAGSSGATLNIQGIVNTSSSSTGSIFGCGSLAGGQLVGVRLS